MSETLLKGLAITLASSSILAIIIALSIATPENNQHGAENTEVTPKIGQPFHRNK